MPPSKVTFSIVVELADDNSTTQVSIGCDTLPVPFPAAMVATEHMMTALALRSSAGFDQALALLVEGARTNRIKMLDGIPTQ